MKAVNGRPPIRHRESVMYRWGLRCFVANVLNASPQTLSGGAGGRGKVLRSSQEIWIHSSPKGESPTIRYAISPQVP
jgi:hypothetical protein